MPICGERRTNCLAQRCCANGMISRIAVSSRHADRHRKSVAGVLTAAGYSRHLVRRDLIVGSDHRCHRARRSGTPFFNPSNSWMRGES